MYILFGLNEKKSHYKRKNCTKYAKNGYKCLKNAIKNANPVFKSFKKKEKRVGK